MPEDIQNSLLQQLEELRNAQRQIEVAQPTPEEIEQERAARTFLSRDLRGEAAKEYDDRTTVGSGRGFLNKLGAALIRGGLGAEAVRNPKGSLDKQIYDEILEEYKVKAPRFQSDLNAVENARARVEAERIRAQGNANARRSDVEKALIQAYAKQGLTDAEAKARAAQATLALAKASSTEEQTKIMQATGLPLGALRGEIAQAIISQKDSALGKAMQDVRKESALFKNLPQFLKLAAGTPNQVTTGTSNLFGTNLKTGAQELVQVPRSSVRLGQPGNPVAAQIVESMGLAPGASGGVSRVGEAPSFSRGAGASGSAQVPVAGSAAARFAPAGGSSPTPTDAGNSAPGQPLVTKLNAEDNKNLVHTNKYADSATTTALQMATITPAQANKFMGGGMAGFSKLNIPLPGFVGDALGGPTVRRVFNKGKKSSYYPGEKEAMSGTAQQAWQAIVDITGKAMNKSEMDLAANIWPDTSRGYIRELPQDFMQATFLQALLGNAAKLKFQMRFSPKPDGGHYTDEEIQAMNGSAGLYKKANDLVARWQRGEKLDAKDFLVDDLYPAAGSERTRLRQRTLEKLREFHMKQGAKK